MHALPAPSSGRPRIGEHHASDAVVHQRLRFLLGCVLACVAAGCSGNSVTTTTAPTPVKCTTNVSGFPASVPATGTKVQATLSEILQLPISGVRVIVPGVGGGFGGKLRVGVEHFAALLARLSNGERLGALR